jgi:predicted MFS family arabinose efflux permease
MLPKDRWYVLSVLTIAYALNIADRFSISTLIEPIQRELHLSDSGIGFLTGVAIAAFYVTIGIPIASLADRANRSNILTLALIIWSGTTVLCGIAQNHLQLLLARFGVGIGEAGGTPPSTSLLADKFAARRRPMALTIFALGACLGAWLGSSVAGEIAERHGWRAAFLALGFPGLFLAIVVWITVKEPPRGLMDATTPTMSPSRIPTTLRYIAKHRSAAHLLAGGTVATLWSWGLMWWIPTFLQRSHHMTIGEAGQMLGSMHLVAGTLSTLLASWLMSRQAATSPRYVLRLLAYVTAIATFPSIALLLVKSDVAVSILLWIFVPAVYFFVGPVLGLLQNVVPPNMRATTCAVLLFTSNIANLVVAPQAIGWLSDGFSALFGTEKESLRWALLFLAPTGTWAAWHFWVCGSTIEEDEARLVRT